MRSLGVTAFALLLAACSARSNGEPPPFSGGELALDFMWTSAPREVRVLVVDDAPTAYAALLRARVVDSVRASMAQDLAEAYQGSCGNPDPAAWHVSDVRFVIARPSAPDSEALLTPMALEDLALTTQMLTAPQGEAVADAVQHALAHRLAGPGDAYRPLRAARRTVELLEGLRAPATAEEAALRASLQPGYDLAVDVLSTRDDEDPTPSDQLALPGVPSGENGPASVWARAVGPETSAGTSRLESCEGYVFSSWSGSLPTWWFATRGWADCGAFCFPHEIAVKPDGRAICELTEDQPDLDSCDPARGLRDPGGEPTFIENEYGSRRVCEMKQLEGPALESCRHSLECPDCPSGWCKTEVPALAPTSSCVAGSHPLGLRYAGGAYEVPGAVLHIRCLLAP